MFSHFFSNNMNTKNLIISALLMAACVCASAQQLDNMSMDQWSKKGGCWNPWPQDAAKHSWDTANHGLSILGMNGATPEYEHVAVKGPGKAAAKIETKKAMGILAAGSVYTGRFIKVVKMSGAKIEMGVPFTGRPKSLSGYVHYIPGKIDVASKKMQHLKGTMDQGVVEISLRDGDQLEMMDTTDPKFQDSKTEDFPNTVGHGVIYFKEDTKDYIYFEIPINYKNGNTPKNIVISTSSSRYAQQFTGSTSSVMYVDELKLNY